MRLRFILFLLLAIFLYACATQARPLKPVRPTPLPTEPFSLVDPDPFQVTFAQIEANPSAYLGQLLRVEASYVAIEREECYPFQGPRFNWGLVADNLQMSARGFERIVELVPDGVPFTVDGVWRQYIGPSGCGKEPLARVVYYLDVADIVQPNPISRVYGEVIADVTPLAPTVSPDGEVIVEEPTPTSDVIIDIATLSPDDDGYPSIIPTLTPSPSLLPSPTQRVIPTNPAPRATVTPSSIDTSTPTLTPTATDEREATSTIPVATDEPNETATPDGALPPTPTLFSRGTATPTPDGTVTATATGTPNGETATPTLTGTPPTATPTPTGTLTVTPAESATPTPQNGGLATTVPTPGGSLPPTATPNGYTGPTETPMPTNTPEGYPLTMTAAAP